MSFYISKKDGKFKIDHSINDKAQFYVKFKSGTSYEVLPVNFNDRLPLGMESSLFIENFTSTTANGGYCHEYSISAFFQKGDANSSELITFKSTNPLGAIHPMYEMNEKALVIFWEMLHVFNSIEDVREIFSTTHVFEYRESEKLSIKLDSLTKIMVKYGDKLPIYLRSDIIEWIKKALLRFGLSTQKLSQPDVEQFPNAVHLLNSMGYQVFKID